MTTPRRRLGLLVLDGLRGVEGKFAQHILDRLSRSETSMSDTTPTDAFDQPIQVGDTVVVSANSSTTSPGLVHARVVGFTPSGALVDLVITRVGREQGTAINEVGAKLRRQTGRVQVLSFREES